MNKTNDITCLIGVGGKKYKPTHFPRFNDSSPPWATLVSLLRQADVCLRLRDPLETADLRLLSHLTNMQLFVVNLLKFHLTTFIIINNINILVIMVKWTRDTGLLQKKEPLLLKKKPTTYHQNLYPNIHQKYTDQP